MKNFIRLIFKLVCALWACIALTVSCSSGYLYNALITEAVVFIGGLSATGALALFVGIIAVLNKATEEGIDNINEAMGITSVTATSDNEYYYEDALRAEKVSRCKETSMWITKNGGKIRILT